MDKQNILTEVATVSNLKAAWNSLNKSNKKSRGPSSVTIKDFEDRLESHLQKLSDELFSGDFSFSPVRGTTISKKGIIATTLSEDEVIQSLRPLRIPDIKDRVVHKALAIAIERHTSSAFNLKNECSFAYQKGVGIEDAIVKMAVYFTQGYKVILEADIIKFFDTINAENLLDKVKAALPDSSVNKLLEAAVKQELCNVEELKSKKVYELYFQSSEAGIPQGNALSPLLANVYLSSFDTRMSEAGFKLIRYADDFIVMCKTRQDALTAYQLAVDELENNLGLRLHPLGNSNKTRIVDPRQSEFTFLSIRFDGEKYTIHSKKVKEFYEKIKCLASREKRTQVYPKEEIGLFQALNKLKNLTDGWIAAYSFTNCESQMEELDILINIVLVQIFESFGINIKRSDLIEVALKSQRRKNVSLTMQQRKSIGIKLCAQTLSKVRKDVLTIQSRVEHLIDLQSVK